MPDKKDLVVMDGKTPLHGRGKAVVTAMTAKSMHYLGCAVVEKETNEIPVTRELFERLDLDGRLVSLDAAHTCMEIVCLQSGKVDGLQKFKNPKPPLTLLLIWEQNIVVKLCE